MQDINTGGSQTQLVGSTDDIKNCRQVVLFNQSESKSKISLYNIETFYKNVVQKSSYLIVTRENPETDAFVYSYRNGSISGFNLIIYLRESDNKPVGYTEFNTIQGSDRNISITFTSTSSTSAALSSVRDFNTLSIIKGSDLTVFLLGDDRNKFISSAKVLSSLPAPSSSYSIHVGDLDENKVLYTSSGSVFKDKFYKCGILRDKNYDPHEVGFTGYSISRNKTDLILLEWVGNKYSIYSMTLSNVFGNPSLYTKDNLDFKMNLDHSLGYCEVPVISGNQRIVASAGRYILVDTDGVSKVYDVTNDIFLGDSIDGEIVLDERAFIPGIVHLFPGYENYVLGFPELLNLYLDLESLFSKNLRIYRKVGPWFIFQHTYSRDSDLYIYASPTLTVYVTKEDLDKIFIVNDSTLLLKETEYYVIYSGISRTYYSERARNLVEGGVLEKVSVIPSQGEILFNTNGVSNSDYIKYYSDGSITVINKSEQLCNTVLERFRRNSYPIDISGIPDIIGCCDGLIFYKNKNTINYL